MGYSEKPVIASLVWSLPSELHELQADIIEKLGYQHHFLMFDQVIPANLDIVLVQGPYGSLLPLARQLVDYPPEHRPVLAYWFQQSLDLRPPQWIRRHLVQIFSELHQYHQEGGKAGYLLNDLFPTVLKSKGNRFGFLGDIICLQRHGILDLLALSSSVYAEHLSQFGITSMVIPRGYHPAYGQLLGFERDIAVVWMGKTRNRRRKQAIYWLKDQLAKRGLVMRIYDGEKNHFIFGEERTHILNRTWFVLNLFTHPTDELSIRYYIAAANGAVILTEPGENQYEFVPGKHLIECPIKEMPDIVQYYLERSKEWQRISDTMLALMKQELTLEESVAKIIRNAEENC